MPVSNFASDKETATLLLVFKVQIGLVAEQKALKINMISLLVLAYVEKDQPAGEQSFAGPPARTSQGYSGVQAAALELAQSPLT